MKKVAVILSGCGVYDGAEIHEAILTLLSLCKKGVQYDIFAPDIEQHHVINHITGEEMNETRNVMIEAARISRGPISDLKDLDPMQYDALFVPGGFGVAKNLSDFAFKGKDVTVLDSFKNAITNAVEAGKPIGALCISPAVIAKIIEGAKLTIGTDEATASVIETLKSDHVITDNPGDIVIDEKYKLVTTACYMEDYSICEINQGIDNVVDAVLAMC